MEAATRPGEAAEDMVRLRAADIKTTFDDEDVVDEEKSSGAENSHNGNNHYGKIHGRRRRR